jgi:hypothetical protein
MDVHHGYVYVGDEDCLFLNVYTCQVTTVFIAFSTTRATYFARNEITRHCTVDSGLVNFYKCKSNEAFVEHITP